MYTCLVQKTRLEKNWSRAPTNVILAGKCGSCRQSTTSFSKNFVVADPRCQILGILSFSDLERVLPPSTEISVLTFVLRKRKEGFESQHGKSVTFAMVETAWTFAIFPSNALLMLATLRPTAQEVQPLSLITSYALNRKKGQL